MNNNNLLVNILLLINLFIKSTYSFPSRASSQVVPPSRIIATGRGEGGGFTGYRQLEKNECITLSKQWQRQLGVVSGDNQIEVFEMVRLLGDCAGAMPGSKPQRRELMAFGEFEEGTIKTVAIGYCTKIKCPWELAVLTIVAVPRMEDRPDKMAAFLKELCRENAIWPDFGYLDRWIYFQAKNWVQQSFVQQRIFAGVSQPSDFESRNSTTASRVRDAITQWYKNCNKAPSIVLDEHDVEALPSFWYQQALPPVLGFANLDYRQTVYFRQKRRAGSEVVDEYEVRFEPPVTGVSSGMATVGCHVVVDVDSEDQMRTVLSDSKCAALQVVSQLLGKKIKRPRELDEESAITALLRVDECAESVSALHGFDQVKERTVEQGGLRDEM